jgi:exodeoxyribonuclease V alpha subunit
METLTGSVCNIVFVQEETGFAVIKLSTKESQNPTVVVGALSSVQPGESLRCLGTWKKHAQYGKQFEVSSFEACVPSDLVGIQKYLESGWIKGIGPTYAKRIIEKFGLNTLQVMDKEPTRLSEVEGIGTKRLQKILLCWEEQRQVRDIMIFLRGHEVSSVYAQKIYQTYKQQSIQKVSEDPFSLTRDIRGIGFKTADKIAMSLNITKESPKRVDAGIAYLFDELSSEGHTCFPKEEFIEKAKEVLDVPCESLRERIEFLVQERHIFEEHGAIQLSTFYYAEHGIAKELERIKASPCQLRDVDLTRAIAWVQEQLHLTLAKEQQEAVMAGLKHKLLIITGGPGTGKSTITKAILRISEKLSSKILFAAPTGRAAKRMSEITHKKAFTIHALLEMDFMTKQFKRGPKNPLSCELLVIDEASMIDTKLLFSLLKAIPSHCRVILIGDVDQLPSVGAGKVLKDLITSEAIPVARLYRIFRQASHSRIVTNAHRINQGFFPDVTPIPGSDFTFIHRESPEEVLQEILYQAVQKGARQTGKVQILSPMKRGILGTENLNTLLQKTLNPSSAPLIRMGKVFHVQDKVMQIKNNYQKEVYNGDIGYIANIDLEEQKIEVSFDDRLVPYEFAEFDELTLAYAVSIHKYQGSECDCIILPIHTSHFKMLNKNLLYTGITRGKKSVILIGTPKAIAIAVHQENSQQRHTHLCAHLQLIPQTT